MDNFITENLAKGSTIGMFVSIGILVYKLSPVTMLTSSSIERKLYSKEKNFIHFIFIYILVGLCFTLFISIMFFLFLKIDFKINQVIFNSVSTIGIVFWLTLVVLNNEIEFCKKQRDKLKKLINKNDNIINYIILYWILILSYYFYKNFFFTAKSNKDFGVAIITTFILSLFMPIFLWPIRDILNKDNKNFSICIEHKKWYILHPIDKDEYLLGDCNELENCKKYMKVKSDLLLNKDICVEEESINGYTPEYYI